MVGGHRPVPDPREAELACLEPFRPTPRLAAVDGQNFHVFEDDTFLGTITLYGARDATTLEGSNASVGVVTSTDIDSALGGRMNTVEINIE